jgi:uncharacterized protein
MPTSLTVFLILFAAVFTQSVTGFGSALIAMGFLSTVLGLKIAAPLFALVGILLELALLIYYRHAFVFRSVWRLILTSLLGVPIGLMALDLLPERVTLIVLGLVLTGYAIYALFNFQLPELHRPAWAFVLGFISGILGGAYNTAGPPVIVYGNYRRWPPAEFKANLQGFFLVGSLSVAVGHAISGNYTSIVWQNFWVSIPAVTLGILAGTRFDQFINPALFRKVVLWGLILIGVSVMF